MKKEGKKRKWVWAVAASVLLLLVIWTIWGNLTVKTTVFEIHDRNLPQGFENYRIAHISDLHNAEFGKDNRVLLDILKGEKPDMIAITGDLVDSEKTDMDIAVSFAEEAVKIAPCYYVPGNHEAWLKGQYDELEKRLKDCGVTVLRNQAEEIASGGDSLWVLGVDDPDFAEPGGGMFDLSAGIIATEIQNTEAAEGYRILLSHRPEVFDTYVEQNINLALCGHAHGGQFRLPFIGGLVAPNQGLLPKYDGGVYTQEDTTMVVSRGIGNSIIPVRFNNRPEIVILSLHRG